MSSKINVVVIGASTPVGSAVCDELALHRTKVNVIQAGKNNETVKVDLQSFASVREMFAQATNLDVVVCCAETDVHFGPVAELTPEKFMVSINGKALSQVNLALCAMKTLRENGCIVLTSGFLGRVPCKQGASIGAANSAIESFVKSAALEMPRNIKINCVSTCLIKEMESKLMTHFPGIDGLPARLIAKAYVRCVFAGFTGKVLTLGSHIYDEE